jgi:SagB-type dehydrogenase family enzyme
MAGELRAYHEATKHSRARLALGARPLDFENKPVPFKIYRDLPPIPAPDDIARLCLLSNGVLRWRRDRRGERYGFRAAACTGALYHVELYLATADGPDLPAGLYHYGAHDPALRRLRSGDVRGVLVRATGGFSPVASSPMVIVVTSTFWRNAWKYRARAYRHAYWDSGVVLANLLAVAAEMGRPSSVLMGFADGDVNALVGADGIREAAVALVVIGDGAPAAPHPTPLGDLALAVEPLSPREIRYPEIEEAHRASSLSSPDDVAGWRERADAVSTRVPAALIDEAVERVIRRRRSTRRFADGPIAHDQLERAIAAATAPVAGDAFGATLVEPFTIVNAVEGLAPGTYAPGLASIQHGDLRVAAGGIALGQELGATAAADVCFLSDLDSVLARFGERGYRVAQMAGGIAGGRVELAATAIGLGATGLTFFDDEVTAVFEPPARGRQVMYLAAVGVPG